ncbi:uncharacterized protein LOC110909614 [Helianthus annuus]|uniref:uncharacterized protein LOC110909614 n=1 Tax=Helianthus annuus TaxID=4232 RepID=UPI000B9046BE|nr:uncharacterized protein LOC110909614 [Helianthus annuus]
MEINHFLFSHFVSLKKAENWISRVSFLSLTLSSRSISSQPSFSFHHHRPPYRPSPSLSATTTALPSLLRRFLGEFQAFSPNCSIFARNPNRPIVRFLGEFQAFSDGKITFQTKNSCHRCILCQLCYDSLVDVVYLSFASVD